MNLIDVVRLCEIAEIEFSDIVASAYSPGTNQVRILLMDSSFIDVWHSLKLAGRHSYHWERLALDNTIYRHDNAPHASWRGIPTFPKHFHNGSELNIIASHISSIPEEALREFLAFSRKTLSTQ